MKTKDEQQFQKTENGIKIVRTIVEEFKTEDEINELKQNIQKAIDKLKDQLKTIKEQRKQMKEIIPSMEEAIKEYEADLEKINRML